MLWEETQGKDITRTLIYYYEEPGSVFKPSMRNSFKCTAEDSGQRRHSKSCV